MPQQDWRIHRIAGCVRGLYARNKKQPRDKTRYSRLRTTRAAARCYLAEKILIVEDDEELRQFLRGQLEAQGFRVVTAGDGEEALRVLGREVPDAIILDLVLPRLDGFTLCRRLRINPETALLPILVLSGKGDQVEEILSPDLGADDFMTGPYNEQELIARLKVLLRRTALSPPARMMRAGSIEVDLDRYIVTVGGREVRFTSKEFELLRTLMEARGRALRREFLLEEVWGYGGGAGVESRTIDVHIRRLREKLGDEGARVLTVRSVGYRFDMSVEWALKAAGRSKP